MQGVDRGILKLVFLTLPWALLRFLGRIIKRFFIALGVLVALVVLGYVGFEFIVESIDSRYSPQISAMRAKISGSACFSSPVTKG